MPESKSPRLPLADYFIVTALNSVSVTVFLQCLFFWTKQRFGYSHVENLALAAMMGLSYIIFAGIGGRAADRIGYDRLLRWGLAGMAITLATGWIPSGRWVPFAVVIVYNIFLSPTWPALEAAVMHGQGNASMPDRLGIYNMTWASGNTVGIVLGGYLVEWKPDAVFWIPAGVHGMVWLWMLLRTSRIGERGATAMEISHQGDAVDRTVKRRFMHLAWLGNSLAYFMITAFSALVPEMGERLGLSPALALGVVCAQFLARVVGFWFFWKWTGWHYRWGWAFAALALAPVGLALMFFSVSVAVVTGASAAFGVAISLTYYGSIYYSLDYGGGKGEHGGLHEAVLGMGAFAGPLFGALAAGVGGAAAGQAAVVVVAGAVSVAGAAVIRGR
ncbi:MAG: MFS transporter [Planctomycetota bacterium]